MEKYKEALVWRIYLVRRLLSEAATLQENTLPISRMKTVLTLDHAIELLTATLLSHLGISVDKDCPLPKMLAQLTSKVPDLQQFKSHIDSLRRLRNLVQHDGIVPSFEDIRQLVPYAEVFVRTAVETVLRQKLEQFLPVLLINDGDAREHLLQAEQALWERDFPKATREAAIAFEIGWRNFILSQRNKIPYTLGEQISEHIVQFFKKVAKTIGSSMSNLYIEAESLRNDLNLLTQILDMLQYGIDLHSYYRFKRIAPRVCLYPNGLEVYEPKDFSPSQADALFAVDFALSSLLTLQQWKTE